MVGDVVVVVVVVLRLLLEVPSSGAVEQFPEFVFRLPLTVVASLSSVYFPS
tara:strand:- start:416 stop:568 length:153 start_codon:yes stop_codon:yes gene_type:complete